MSTMTIRPDADLFVNVLAHIERDKDRWDQGNWMTAAPDDYGDYCGTTGCFAGWACTLAATGQPYIRRSFAELRNVPTAIDYWRQHDGTVTTIATLAFEMLYGYPLDAVETRAAFGVMFDALEAGEDIGITLAQAEAISELFGGSNSEEDLYDLVATILAMDVDDLHVKVDNRVCELEAQEPAPKPYVYSKIDDERVAADA